MKVRGDTILTTVNELLFFDSKPDALALYEAFREAVLAKAADARIEVKKTQISFFDLLGERYPSILELFGGHR